MLTVYYRRIKLSRSNQHPVGKVIASTKAKTDSTISGTEYHA